MQTAQPSALSQVPFPQQSPQSSGQEAHVSPWSHALFPQHAPQSAGQVAQVSPLSHALFPQHEPQSCEQEAHVSPLSQELFPQHAPQSVGHVAQVSAPLHCESPHPGATSGEASWGAPAAPPDPPDAPAPDAPLAPAVPPPDPPTSAWDPSTGGKMDPSDTFESLPPSGSQSAPMHAGTAELSSVPVAHEPATRAIAIANVCTPIFDLRMILRAYARQPGAPRLAVVR